jgi:hypothetical protein
MQAVSTIPRREDSQLWLAALGISLLANLLLLVLAGMAAIELGQRRAARAATSPPAAETVITIQPVMPEEETAAASQARRPFARTTPDQAAEPLRDPAFIGERATRATSDRAPVVGAPPLPSQAGINPRDTSDIETTESRYQDGELAQESARPPASPAASPPLAAREPLPPEFAATPAATAPPPERLLDGPFPVDVPAPPEAAAADEIKPAAPPAAVAETPPPTPARPAENTDTPPAPATEATVKPAFRGHQRKTAIIGSISRSGRSSLDVEDSLLGRYQAAISRAVELEWQRNCVRHRDFITPGFLTVRFFVENNGRVRSVQFVGDMETGEVQKGFTLNSIRDAAIPPMPMGLRADFKDDPLELIFRFYF